MEADTVLVKNQHRCRLKRSQCRSPATSRLVPGFHFQAYNGSNSELMENRLYGGAGTVCITDSSGRGGISFGESLGKRPCAQARRGEMTTRIFVTAPLLHE